MISLFICYFFQSTSQFTQSSEVRDQEEVSYDWERNQRAEFDIAKSTGNWASGSQKGGKHSGGSTQIFRQRSTKFLTAWYIACLEGEVKKKKKLKN